MTEKLLSGLIAALIAAIVSIYVRKQTSNSDLDQSSEWRKSLLEVASKHEIGLDEAQRVRASLRFRKHDVEPLLFSFDWMTNQMINYLEKYVLYDGHSDHLTRQEIDIVRLFATFLLKHHFEYRQLMGPAEYFNFRNNHKKPSMLVKEAFLEYLKLRNKEENTK